MDWSPWLCLALTLAYAPTGAAQHVHGIVHDTASGEPVPGAVVSALDAQGSLLAWDLTNAAGGYTIGVRNGAATLRILRLGFRPRSVPMPHQAGGSTRVDVALQRVVSLSEPVSIDEEARCPKRDDRQQALGLWEQAQAGLLALVAARDTRPGEMHSIVYQRWYAPGGDQLIGQQLRPVDERTARPFVPSRPVADFAEHGYGVCDAGGCDFDLPDADVLLDGSFAAAHCFSIAADDGVHAGEVGLAFDPAKGREQLVDIAGVLWINRRQEAIQSLEFRYTGLGKTETPVSPGGTLSFNSVPNGAVFIGQWSITTPSLPGVAAGSSGGASFDRHVSGGTVLSARWDDGTRWHAPVAGVRGRVESDSGVGMRGVEVWLSGTGDTTLSDSAGVFDFDDVVPGTYALGAAGPALAPAGVSQTTGADSVHATGGGVAHPVIRLQVPAVAVRQVCGSHTDDSIPASMLVVRVLDADGWIAWREGVTVKWREPDSDLLGIRVSHHGTRIGTTDGNGRVELCGVPRDQPLDIAISQGKTPQIDSTFTLPSDRGIAVITLRLPRQPGH
jgi:Carboxypeptidase regulatory-like domain